MSSKGDRGRSWHLGRACALASNGDIFTVLFVATFSLCYDKNKKTLDRFWTARAFLEFDHVQPRKLGGRHQTTDQIQLLCRAHNQRRAELSYGVGYVEEKKRRPRMLMHELEAMTRDVEGALARMGFSRAEARSASRAARDSFARGPLRRADSQATRTAIDAGAALPPIQDFVRSALAQTAHQP